MSAKQSCDCGGLKWPQSRVCWECYLESRRGEAYWARRTCPECGGPKSYMRQRCQRCAWDRQVGRTGTGKPQPENHPWRQTRYVA